MLGLNRGDGEVISTPSGRAPTTPFNKLRRWLSDRGELPTGPLVAMIPVSVRDEAAKGKLGNKVSAMLANLPTHLDDPAQRLTVVHEATKIAKSQQATIPQDLVDDISDFAPPALTARAARVVFATGLLHRLPAFNVCISNVPGPNIPVYLGGARLLANYPVSVITNGQGLNITWLAISASSTSDSSRAGNWYRTSTSWLVIWSRS